MVEVASLSFTWWECLAFVICCGIVTLGVYLFGIATGFVLKAMRGK